MRRLVQLLILLSAFGVVRTALAVSAFSLDQTALDFGSVNAGTSPAFQVVTLTNNTGSGLSVQLSSSTQSGGNWLSASISRDPVPGNGTASIRVSVSSSTLQPGAYAGTVTVKGGGTTATISVTFSISGVSISANSPINVTVLAGEQTQFSVHVSGGPVTVQINTSPATPWLTADGSVDAPGSFGGMVDATSLSVGPHPASLSLQCVGGSPCVPIAVLINVTVKLPTSLVSSVSSLTFQAYQGRPDPPAQKLKITTSDGAPLSFTVTGAPTWIQASTPGSVASSTAILLTVSVTASGLSSGANSGTVTLTASNGTPDMTIAVSATLSAFSISVSPNPAAPVNLNAGQIQTVQLQVNTADGASTGVAVVAKTDDGANWLKAPVSNTNAPAQLNVMVDASTLVAGNYTGSLTFSCTVATCAPVKVPFTVTVGSVPPAIKSGGVRTAGDFGGFSSISAGAYAEIFGAGLATTQRPWATGDFIGGVAPTMLDGVRVTINGQSAFVNYVSGGQVNIVVPENIGNGSGQMILTNSAGSTAPYSVNISALQPGLLAPASFLIKGKQYVVALLGDGSYVLPTGSISGVSSRPAKPGETIVLYGLGFGPVDPNVPTGNIAQGLTKLHSPLQILFGQTPAVLKYDGLAPGFVGLCQINLVVPPVSDSDTVPLTFNLGGATGSQTLYIAVHQ